MTAFILAAVIAVSYFGGCYVGHKLFVKKFKKQLTNLL